MVAEWKNSRSILFGLICLCVRKNLRWLAMAEPTLHTPREITPRDFYLLGLTCHHVLAPPPSPTQTRVEMPPPLQLPPQLLAEMQGRTHTPPRSTRPSVNAGVFKHKLVVFDTETCGLSQPAIIQLAYAVVEEGDLSERDVILRRPPRIAMSRKAVAIHGITAARSDAGNEPIPVLVEFHELVRSTVDSGGEVFAHNSKFDVRAFNFTAEQLGLRIRLNDADIKCTMRSSSNLSTLKTKNGRHKQFKNSELYEYMMGTPPTWARLHNALDDIRVTLLSLCTARERGFF